jgi:hypothetical protein
MIHQKKCPACGHWNEGDLKNCASCGGLMDKNELIKEERKKKGLYQEMKKHEKMFEVFPDDPVWLKIIKHIVAPIYWAFMAVLGFFMWFIATMAG